mgnify:CR=1 FL=1
MAGRDAGDAGQPRLLRPNGDTDDHALRSPVPADPLRCPMVGTATENVQDAGIAGKVGGRRKESTFWSCVKEGEWLKLEDNLPQGEFT